MPSIPLRILSRNAEELQKKVDEVVNEMKQAPTSKSRSASRSSPARKMRRISLSVSKELNNRVEDVKKELQTNDRSSL